MWAVTQECVYNRIDVCSGDFVASVEFTMSLFEEIMGVRCVDLCYIERAESCVASLELLVQPILTIGDDFEIDYSFCG